MHSAFTSDLHDDSEHTLVQFPTRTSSHNAFRIPANFGPYRIIHSLGHGGSARVLLAEKHTMSGLARKVALKLAEPDCDGHNEMLLRHEGAILQKLRHPNIIDFHDAGVINGRSYCALEGVDGWTLKELLRMGRPIPLSVCLDFGLQLCSALGYLHGTGGHRAPNTIIHSDLKPANIMVDRFGRLTLIDFGIAREADRAKRGGTTSGTAAYMAPEQVLQGEVCGRTDLFALGVVLYEMATGTRLFPGTDIPELLQARLRSVSLPKTGFIHALLGDHLHHFMGVLQTAIRFNPEDRYPDARRFAAALRAIQRKIGTFPSSEVWIQRATRQRPSAFQKE